MVHFSRGDGVQRPSRSLGWKLGFIHYLILLELGVVQVINRITTSSRPVVRLLRHLVLRCLQLNVLLYAVHIPGVDNTLADSLSQFQWDRFRDMAPAAERDGRPCPGWLWEVALEPPQAGSGSR